MAVRPVPRLRLTLCNDAPVRPAADYVVYWMTAARRMSSNFALDRAVALAVEHGRPLLVFEALRTDYPWASDRLHRFVMDGMADNAARCAAAGVTYFPYVEPSKGAGKGLLRALADRAVAVVTDDAPYFFLPRMRAAGASQCPVRMEAVDGNGLLPLRANDHAHVSAYVFRRMLQHVLLPHLAEAPSDDALPALAGLPAARIPDDVLRRWEPSGQAPLAALPIDHDVRPSPVRGGERAGAAALARFVDLRLARYDEDRNHPDVDATSGLSPYLHFGHVGAHQVFAAVRDVEGWAPPAIQRKVTGTREGWWGVRAPAEAFLDQVVTWRELGLAECFHRPGSDRYETLPAWAQATLEKHRADPRPSLYGPAEFEAAATHDRIWNAAQTQLVREGVLQNYMRMLWGKKVLEWSRTPEEAFATLLHLNDKYALDGRDPNSVSGIAWSFGRYDRPWGPERPVFGNVRFMSTDAAARKLRLTNYLRRHAAREERPC